MRLRNFAVFTAMLLPFTLRAQVTNYPGERWDTVAGVDRQKWSQDSLRAIGEFVSALGSGAVVVIDDGRLVAQWGEPHRPFPLTSVRKSLLHSLLGIEVGGGRLRIESTLADLGIDDHPALTPSERRATVLDLLASRSGIYHGAAYEPASMRSGRPQRGSTVPGQRWFYNNWDFNALGTIYEKVSGRNVFAGFEESIARVIGMEDFRVSHGESVRESVSVHAAYTFRLSASDLARYILLYARGGKWNDVQVVPEDWVKLGTRAHTTAGEDGAYGMLWWSEVNGHLVPGASLDSGAFAARGLGPHYAVAIPSRNLIIVHLANTDTPGPSNWVERRSVGTLITRVLNARSGGGTSPTGY